MEILIITLFGAIVSVLNTLWLREALLKQIEKIAKSAETNVIKAKVIDISDKIGS